MTALKSSPAWKALKAHHAQIGNLHLRAMFNDDPGRADRFSAEGVDYFWIIPRTVSMPKRCACCWGLPRNAAWRTDATTCSPVRRSTSRNAAPCFISLSGPRAAPHRG